MDTFLELCSLCLSLHLLNVAQWRHKKKVHALLIITSMFCLNIDIILRAWRWRAAAVARERGKHGKIRYIKFMRFKVQKETETLACNLTSWWLKDVCVGSSHRDRAGPKTRRRVLRLKARGGVQIWTIRVRFGWSWKECSPCTGLWTGTPAPSQSTTCRTRPGPLQQTQRTAAGRPCPPARGIWVRKWLTFRDQLCLGVPS